jgi:predicted component of type VI protein secretion system
MEMTFIVLGCFAKTQELKSPLGEKAVTLHRIDLDTYDSVLQQLHPALTLHFSDFAEPIRLTFTHLDDFHPDQLCKKLPQSDKTENELFQSQPHSHVKQGQAHNSEQESNEQTLSRLLGDRSLSHPAGSGPHPKSTLIESVVDRLVSDSLQGDEPQTEPVSPESSAPEGSCSTDLLRRVLHHPAFQALESSWRGLDWLLRSLESEEFIELFAINLPSANWDKALLKRLEKSLEVHFSERSSSAQKIFLISDRDFTNTPQDIDLLEGLGQIAVALNAQLIAGAAADFVPSQDVKADVLSSWSHFKTTELATRINLVLPRILLRLPYGERYDPVEQPAFEELDPDWKGNDLLWGSSPTR